MSQNVTESRLTPRQIEALEALMNREPDETLEDCGKRAGVSRRTMHRYLRDSDFNAEYRARVALEFSGQRGRMAQALVKGGATPGPGQASMQKIFWTMLGELTNSVEISGPNSGPIALSSEDYQRANSELAEKLARRPDVLAEIARLAGVGVPE